MSHFGEYSNTPSNPDGRALGDEWSDWDGKSEGIIHEGVSLFFLISSIFVTAINFFLFLSVYMITPRLTEWADWLPSAALIVAIILSSAFILWLITIVLTAASGLSFFLNRRFVHFFFRLFFEGIFSTGKLFGLSRDRIGHSFVRVSNSLSKAAKLRNQKDERLLILLPRCLSKEELKHINNLKQIYPIEIHTVSGGELARKKVREYRPTAVIGVACERDLVSGIRDVGQKISVFGIPNQRPEGPCKNTHIDMNELISAIEFYVGPAVKQDVN